MATNEEMVLVLRVCRADMSSDGANGRPKFYWPQSGKVCAPDFDPQPVCGYGLHGWLWGNGDLSAISYWNEEGARWLVVEVAASDVVLLEDGSKVKFPEGNVIFCGDRVDAANLIAGRVPADAKPIMFRTATAGYAGTATAGYAGTATAGNRGTATAGYAGTATAGNRGTATAGNRGTATAGDAGTATAGYAGTATAGYAGTATAGYAGTATAGNRGTATAGDAGTATAGNRGTATAGDAGTATAGDAGTATAGYAGTATAGDSGTVQIEWFDTLRGHYRKRSIEIDTDGEHKPGFWYRINSKTGKFIVHGAVEKDADGKILPPKEGA